MALSRRRGAQKNGRPRGATTSSQVGKLPPQNELLSGLFRPNRCRDSRLARVGPLSWLSSQPLLKESAMPGAVAPGQKPFPARDWPAATPAVRPFLTWEEGVTLIEGEVAEAGRTRPAYAYVSR